MNFWECLSKIFPDALVKVDNKKIDNSNNYFFNSENPIKITKEGVFFEGKKVGEKDKTNKILEEISKHKKEESLSFQLIHEDLENEFISYQKLCEKNSSSLQKLKEVLPKEEIECILISRRIEGAYKSGNQGLVIHLENQLEKNFPKKGKKVANLIKTGYFDEIIIPMIDICKEQHSENYREKYYSFYKETLIFFPLAIFVNNEVDFNWIFEEIQKRLKLRKIPLIRIHAMGEKNISKVEKAVKKLSESKSGKFSINEKVFKSSTGILAQNLEIRINRNYL